MVEVMYTKETKPFPNNSLPILYYPKAVVNLLDGPEAAQRVLALFEKNGYSNGWTNGIFSYHHFHSNTHEVLACITGEATVQLGGPDAQKYSFAKGDVLLLPAGVAHKRIDASNDFKIVGAYPDGLEPDIQKGGTEHYESIKQTIATVNIPAKDPLEGEKGALVTSWT
ncbi:cupin domain-containing protein [Carnobacterium pleistocenium]|uniref:cupin domain-containing protein n=1 Tax=Carnobacterium pleistocenium TaxID=181073 RepID=UPI000554FF3F|nr:cupin domain-containing protein [Carnobacterium pleistocenium]